MRAFLLEQLRQPYGPLVPWIGLAALLCVGLWFVNSFGVESAQQGLERLEGEWKQARRDLQIQQDARRAQKDVMQVWSTLPPERDFAPLALGITEEAKRNRVILPALTYKTEATPVSGTTKGVLQGTMTGRYEDLRRFLYDIETAEEPVYIEDLELVRTASREGQQMTFNIRIATFLRKGNSDATGQ
jgi:Tfp pilus assembly protein PilO